MASVPQHRNRSVDATQFAMVPRADVPRSVFRTRHSHKTTFNAGLLIPVYLDEILPGDSHRVSMTAFCRIPATVFPVMDNLHLDSFFFFVPCRLVWDNWEKLMGAQATPGASTTYLTPQTVSAAGGWGIATLGDYFGLPTAGQVGAMNTVSVQSMPFRAYNLIYNEWFRDQNIMAPLNVPMGDGPDTGFDVQTPAPRLKRPDYFTTALPWPAKPTSLDPSQLFPWQGAGQYDRGQFGAPVYLSNQVGVPVSGLGGTTKVSGSPAGTVYEASGLAGVSYASAKQLWDAASDNQVYMALGPDGLPDVRVAVAAIRQAFMVQRLLERDARGGTRYTEMLRAHFGVVNPDGRLQRPEYLGGGSTPIHISPIAQTSETAETPLGELSGIGTVLAQHGFSHVFTEHGFVIGLVNVRADITYQQGLRRMWRRRTRFDYYWPAFAHLGEQAVNMFEIYCDGSATDGTVFGYQERWQEYRQFPGQITGFFRSTLPTGTLDAWHFAEEFPSNPVLDAAFLSDPTYAVLERALSAGELAIYQQILFDGLFDVSRVRPMPVMSVPGLVDHF